MHTNQHLESYKAKLEGKLQEWNAEADRLQAKAKQAGANAEMKLREQAEAIKQKETEARRKLTEFGNASKDAAERLKAGLDKAVNEFGTAVDQARAQFH